MKGVVNETNYCFNIPTDLYKTKDWKLINIYIKEKLTELGYFNKVKQIQC